MNAERRRKIKYVLDDIDNVIVALTEIRDEEQSSLDNAIEALDEVVFSITNDVI